MFALAARWRYSCLYFGLIPQSLYPNRRRGKARGYRFLHSADPITWQRHWRLREVKFNGKQYRTHSHEIATKALIVSTRNRSAGPLTITWTFAQLRKVDGKSIPIPTLDSPTG